MTIGSSSLRVVALAVAALAAGCASFSEDGGFDGVAQTVRERSGKEAVWARTDAERERAQARVRELLGAPLSADTAVQVALLANPGLQAAYQDLGLSEAALVSASRLPNPHFAMLSASRVEDGVREFKIEQALTFNLMALLTVPQATAIERRRFEQTQRTIALEVLRLASETRKAWLHAVAAQEMARYLRQIAQAADAGADLAQRMARAGNFSTLQRAREQGFYAEATLALARAERVARAQRERLTRLLGLWGEQTRYTLPDRLPELPGDPRELPDVERVAIGQRLDLAAARIETEALAGHLGLTKTTRFINVLEFGPARVLEGTRDSPYKTGYEIAFELPLFDWGSAKVARAEALYMRQLHRAAELAISARSEVREAYDAYRGGWDEARHYRDEIVPTARRVSEENLLRYNGMLIGVFDLLADTRAQVAAVNGYIEALRDFWIAEADLDMSLIGRPSLTAPIVTAGPSAAVGGGGPAH
jgi:outer membrane protein TolC